MFKATFIAGIGLVCFAQSVSAQVKCLPTSTNPTNRELLKAVACLQAELNKPTPPGKPDPGAVRFGDNVVLRFADMSWCLARGDAGDTKAYTIQCSPGAPGSGIARLTLDKAQ